MGPLALGLLGGSCLPVQTSVNTRLGRAVGSPFTASLLSSILGTVVLLGVVLALSLPLLPPPAAYDEPWWIWVAGFLGVAFLTVNLVLLPRLGAVQTAIFPIVGQVLMGLVVDAFGLFRAPQADLTVLRGLGGGLVVAGAVGVTLASRYPIASTRLAGGELGRALDTAGGAGTANGASAWAWRVVGLANGMVSAAQSAINGHLGVTVGSPISATFLSFLIGTVGLAVLVLILRTHRALPRDADGRRRPVRGPWWMWIGGLLGPCYVGTNAALVPVLGAGTTVVVVLLGNLAAAMLIDRFGVLGNPRRPVTWRHLSGLAVLVAGIVLIRVIA